MPDGQWSRQGFHHRGAGKIVPHIAKAACLVESLLRVVGDDSARFLTAVLQSMQTQSDETGCILDAYDAKNSTFFLQLILIRDIGIKGINVKRIGRQAGVGQGVAPVPERQRDP